jgi:hypothetical protein
MGADLGPDLGRVIDARPLGEDNALPALAAQ